MSRIQEMSTTSSKLKDVLHCALCFNKYNTDSFAPLVLPCGKTLCKSCVIKNTNESSNSVKCPFCNNQEHKSASSSKRVGDFPTNDALLVLITEQSRSGGHARVNFDKQGSNASNEYKFRRLNAILNDIEANTVILDADLKHSRDVMLEQYNQVEIDVNTRANQLIESIKDARNSILKELNTHKKTTLSNIDECNSFNRECKKNYQRLVDTKNSMSNVIDDDELKSVCLLADELNERIVKTKQFLDGKVKSDILFHRSSSRIQEAYQLLGRLNIRPLKEQIAALERSKSDHFRSPSQISTFRKSSAVSSGRHSLKSIDFKVPFNCKNLLLSVLSNKTVVKVVESVIIDEYSYKLNISLIKNSDMEPDRQRVSEEIGSFRLKRVKASMWNNHILVLLVNKFLNSYGFLKLYSPELKLVKSLEVNYTPVDAFANKQGIYVLAVSENNKNHLMVHHYDYALNQKDTLNFIMYTKQANINQDKYPYHYFIDKSLKLIGIESGKFFFLDTEKSRVRAMNGSDGEFKTVKLGDDFESGYNKENLLIGVDPLERINVYNRRQSRIDSFNVDGELLSQKKIEPKLIHSVDSFFVFEDLTYCIVDRKTNHIHFLA